ncbi:MAG: molybdate ABC transporter permease subunit [Gammaproteobacteria bacterium]|nr:molybdate ABC transporter permease subunit [Gammaproteobacteria bacterium]
MAIDVTPFILTFKLAALTVFVLLILGTPLAWWLATTRSATKTVIESITALPLVLPPTVLGFYMLILLGPNGTIGEVWQSMFGVSLTFSFSGLVIASCFYSLPFVVQPLQTAFELIDKRVIEASWTLGKSKVQTFFLIVMPLARRGFITALVLGFAHTVGEFGVVLMVGGNIPGETKVISIAIYEQVETIDFASAHISSAILLLFSFIVLLAVYTSNRRWYRGVRV